MTKLNKTNRRKKKSDLINYGLTLVNKEKKKLKQIYCAGRLFQDLDPNHFNSCITHAEDFKFVIINDNLLFESGDGFMPVDDKS